MQHYPLQGKAKGIKPDRRFGVGDPKAVRRCLQHLSGSSFNDTNTKLYLLLPFPWTILVVWRGEDCCLDNNWSSTSSCRPSPAPWRGHSSFVKQHLIQHEKQQSTGCKPQCLIGVEPGVASNAGRDPQIFFPTGLLPPSSSWAAPASKVLSHHGLSASAHWVREA